MKDGTNRYCKVLYASAIVLLAIMGCTRPTMAQERNYHTVLVPNSMSAAILDSVCHSVEKCLCVVQDIPCYGNIVITDSLLVIRIEQLTDVLPTIVPYVCYYGNIPFFIHYSSDLEKLFQRTSYQIPSDTIFERLSEEKGSINGYATPIERKDYYEARYAFDIDRGCFALCCEHSCVANKNRIPNLQPQNIHYHKKSADSLFVVSPYVDTLSVAVAQLFVSFNNIRQMKILEINDLSYLWVYKSRNNNYPDKEYFYYDGCSVQDSVQYQYYKSKIIEIAHQLHFYVPKKYKMFPKIKKKYGYDDFLIEKYQVSESEPVRLTIKVFPCSF